MGNSKFADKVCYGYKKDDDGQLIIDEKQARIVEYIFSLYMQGNSLRKIADKLYERGILSPAGKENWTPMAIRKILTNEKYMGNVILQKTYVKDFFEHTQALNNNQFTKYLYENNNPPIISKKTFEVVQKTLEERSNVEIGRDGKSARKSTRYSSNNLLSGKIKCQICGKNFRRITTHSGEVVWRCAGRVEKNEIKCTARTVKQSEIIEAINQAVSITDLHLDFSYEYVEFIVVDGFEIKVCLKDIDSATKTKLLHEQDHWLVQHSINGDVRAKEILYEKHINLLRKKLKYVQRQYRLQDMDIEDLEQTIWLKIYSKLENYNSQYRFWSSLLLGAIMGWVLTQLEKLFNSNTNRLNLTIAAVFLTVSISMLNFEVFGIHIHFSSLLTCMMLGTVFCNICPLSHDLMAASDKWTSPLFALFFVISGAELELNVFKSLSIVLIGVIYIITRCIGKYIGTFISAKATNCSPQICKYLGITLFPQAGVALGMCATAMQLGEQGALIRNITLFAALIYELFGPVFTRMALTAAGEIKPKSEEVEKRRQIKLDAAKNK